MLEFKLQQGQPYYKGIGLPSSRWAPEYIEDYNSFKLIKRNNKKEGATTPITADMRGGRQNRQEVANFRQDRRGAGSVGSNTTPGYNPTRKIRSPRRTPEPAHVSLPI